MNWPGRRREEGGSEHIAHIRVIQVLPVADNWIDEDGIITSSSYLAHTLPILSILKILNIYNIYDYQVLIFMLKHTKKILPSI